MKSLITIAFENEEQYWSIIQKVEPEFYLIRFAMKQYGINPMILPRVIRAIANLSAGDGYGKVIVYMQAKQITNVETVEHDKVDEPSTIDKEK